MIPPPLRFVPYEDTRDLANVVVDGSANDETVLAISHWPGVPAPPRCEADTSAQMVFFYLDSGAHLHGEASVVTNNHFDQDGLAGVYAMVNPEETLVLRAQLEDLAGAGDFAVFSGRTSARLSMAVAALADPTRTPRSDLRQDYSDQCAVLYREALELLPGGYRTPTPAAICGLTRTPNSRPGSPPSPPAP